MSDLNGSGFWLTFTMLNRSAVQFRILADFPVPDSPRIKHPHLILFPPFNRMSDNSFHIGGAYSPNMNE
jgi:hypothetical protein